MDSKNDPSKSKSLAELTKGGTILIVDDNRDQADSVAMLMKLLHKVNVKPVYNLREAREIIKQSEGSASPVVAVVSDDGLIGEQGRTFADEVKKGSVPGLKANTPVVLLSGTGDLVGDHVITKARPDEMDTVVRTLQHMLQQNEMAAANADHKPQEREMGPEEIRSHVASLRSRQRLADEMGKPQKDWRAQGSDVTYYHETDEDNVRALKEQERHRMASRMLGREIAKWEERIEGAGGDGGHGGPGGKR